MQVQNDAMKAHNDQIESQILEMGLFDERRRSSRVTARSLARESSPRDSSSRDPESYDINPRDDRGSQAPRDERPPFPPESRAKAGESCARTNEGRAKTREGKAKTSESRAKTGPGGFYYGSDRDASPGPCASRKPSRDPSPDKSRYPRRYPSRASSRRGSHDRSQARDSILLSRESGGHNLRDFTRRRGESYGDGEPPGSGRMHRYCTRGEIRDDLDLRPRDRGFSRFGAPTGCRRSQTERPYRSPINVFKEWGYTDDDSN